MNRKQVNAFYREALRRIGELPGVERVAVGTLVPWREAGGFGPGFQFTAEGYAKVDGEEDPRGRFRSVSSGFFSTLGVPLIAGRDFNESDRSDAEKVVIVSQSLAQRMFPNQDAVNRQLTWTDPVMKFIGVSPERPDESSVWSATSTTRTWFPVRRSRSTTRSNRSSAVVACSCMRAPIPYALVTPDHADHSRPLRRSAGRKGGNARRRARRGAGAESAQRAGVRRLCRCRAPDRHRRRRRRARVFGERAYA